MTAADCTELRFDTLVDYWAGELSPEEELRAEEHLMSCAACTARSARVAAVTEAIRDALPPLVTAERVARLRARGVRMIENVFLPGDRREVTFPSGVDLLIHRLSGLDLSRAVKVSFSLTSESTGERIVELDDVPFERETGSLLVACQKHYAAYPADTVASVRVHREGGEDTSHRYVILHQFPSEASG